MTDRRQELGRHYLQPGSPAYKAIKQAIEDQGVRTEEIFDRLEKRMDRLDRDIARADQSQDRLANELVEMRRDVGELRDATHIAANKAAKEAKSAAEVVVSAAKPKLWQKWQAWAVAFVAFVALYKNVGTLARDMTSFWRYIIGEAPPAQVRHIEKKDEAK